MIRLLKIELRKLIFSPTFWVLLGLYILLIPPSAYIFEYFIQKVLTAPQPDGKPNPIALMIKGYSIFNLPDIWKNLAFIARWFKLILAIMVIIMVTNEYSYKTLRQNIIDGMKKIEVIWAKELIIIILTIISVLIFLLITAVFAKSPNNQSFWDGAKIIFPYSLAIFMYLNFAYFMATLLKKAGLAILLLLVYSIIVEGLATFALPENIKRFFPMHNIENLIPNPLKALIGRNTVSDFSATNIAICCGYIVLFVGLNYWMLKRGNAAKQ